MNWATWHWRWSPNRLPVVNEESSLRRSKRDIGFDDDEDEDLDFDFEFGDFPSQFDEASFAPDPNFEPSIDLPVGMKLILHNYLLDFPLLASFSLPIVG